MVRRQIDRKVGQPAHRSTAERRRERNARKARRDRERERRGEVITNHAGGTLLQAPIGEAHRAGRHAEGDLGLWLLGLDRERVLREQSRPYQEAENEWASEHTRMTDSEYCRNAPTR